MSNKEICFQRNFFMRFATSECLICILYILVYFVSHEDLSMKGVARGKCLRASLGL